MNTDTLKIWRAEIAADLATAKGALPALEAESVTAGETVRSAEQAVRELQAALATIARPSPLITGRLQEFNSARSSARGNQVRAASVLQVHRNRIKELEAALAQLDQVIDPATAEAA